MLLNTTILYPNHAKIAPRNFIIQFLSNFNKKNTEKIVPFCQKPLIVISISPPQYLASKIATSLILLIFAPL